MQICSRNENSWTHVVYLFVEPIVHNLLCVRLYVYGEDGENVLQSELCVQHPQQGQGTAESTHRVPDLHIL